MFFWFFFSFTFHSRTSLKMIKRHLRKSHQLWDLENSNSWLEQVSEVKRIFSCGCVNTFPWWYNKYLCMSSMQQHQWIRNTDLRQRHCSRPTSAVMSQLITSCYQNQMNDQPLLCLRMPCTWRKAVLYSPTNQMNWFPSSKHSNKITVIQQGYKIAFQCTQRTHIVIWPLVDRLLWNELWGGCIVLCRTKQAAALMKVHSSAVCE